MAGLKQLFQKHAVVLTLIALVMGSSAAMAVEDEFTVELDDKGMVVGGQGTGFEHGSWYYYPNTDWWNQWFYNGYHPDRKKVVGVDVTLRVLDPLSSMASQIEVALNWSTPDWPIDMDGPPLPEDIKGLDQEERLIRRTIVIPLTDIGQSKFINTSYEIEDYCPTWISIDVRGTNISVEGQIRHDCVEKGGTPPPVEELDFGDAPEGALAYPLSGVVGQFPTCVGVGPAAWIQHDSRWLYFGENVDVELDGNGGLCPLFNPETYNQDEKVRDHDAGLIKPRAFTIRGPVGSERVYSLTSVVLESLGETCDTSVWGSNIDIEVHNLRPDGRDGYVNLLIDWNQDGVWQKSVDCGGVSIPEHVLVNFPVPQGYSGPLSALNPPNFRVGPASGDVWIRFTVTERPVPEGWNGDGLFTDGETEDYLVYIEEALNLCDWDQGDPHKMHWAQLPDQFQTGLDVDMFWAPLADDFECTQNGPITDIHFWGSFMDDVLPQLGANSLTFEINIYSNRPADSLIAWSRPGELLWSKKVPRFRYDVSEVSNNIYEGWFDPASKFYERDNHKRTFQYNICLDPTDDLFVQKAGTIYWLQIKELPGEDDSYAFGWKTTQQRLQFKDSATWKHPQLGWLAIVYPDGHEYEAKPLDLSFVITGEPVPELDYGDAPDPAYPTVFISDGARHTIVRDIRLGNGIDGEVDGQPNATATGDDNDGNDDEDGVVFVTSVVPGEKATVEVTASIKGILNAWIDWNADGDWDDVDEHIFIDESLAAGLNSLVIDVPGRAVPGETFTRFRFSTVSGLDYDGRAPDGEVEDYRVRISEIVVPPVKPSTGHLKWSQPPIEHDPGLRAPVYCGWDEPAYAQKVVWFGTATWKLVADDFRCVGTLPVTSVHWWGSYEGWVRETPPSMVPESWRVAFWSNVGADNRYPFSRPDKLLWLVNVPAGRVTEVPVGKDEFPGKPTDQTFQYTLALQPQEVFQQSQFAESETEDRIFWISITAVYTDWVPPQNEWGWKTRPQVWMDAAISAEFSRDELRAGITLDAAKAEPITNSLVCERLDRFDMAFELDTDPDYIKWEQPFTGLRDWPHYEDEESMATEGPGLATKWVQDPDLGSTGIDVDITKDLPPTWPPTISGDDFECTTSGPITGITLWTSWYHDILPSGSASNVTYTLSIREDIPASRSPTGYSMPGKVLWRKEFGRGEFTVEPIQGQTQSYYSPANQTFERSNHLMVYRYTFDIDPAEAFRQTGTPSNPTVYWLTAQGQVVHAPGSVATRLGWKTSLDHWNDDAVWVEAQESYSGSGWGELRYPKEHPLGSRSIDLAFEIETERSGAGQSLRRIVADDWRCRGNLPVTGLVWWGSYIGYGYQPCECQQMPAPRQPDHFLLSIWADVPDPDPGNPNTFSRPGTKVWEYEAATFDEVMVGFDKHPEAFESHIRGFEPVYRYTVRLPLKDWFCQRGQDNVYWLSVVAVYTDAKSIVYPWGWTNHPQAGWDLQGQDMLAHWMFDETGGVTAADSSGHGNDGTLKGNPLWQPFGGWLGGAIDLDGKGDYVSVDKPAGFDFAPNSFSVSAWINARDTKGQWNTIMEYNRGGLDDNRFGLWLDPDGRFHFRVGWTTWHSAQGLNPNQWYHLVATYNRGTRQMKLYVDGALDGQAVLIFGFSNPTVSNLTIGVRGSGDDEYFDGLIDDVRVFDSTLTQEDILTLVGAGRNDDAVAADLGTPSVSAALPWRPLVDQTGRSEDMSFMLLTDPHGCVGHATQGASNSGDAEKKSPAVAKTPEKR